MLQIAWDEIDAGTFEWLCGDTIRALLPPDRRSAYVSTSMPYRGDFQLDGQIEFQAFGNLRPPVCISCKTTDPNSPAATSSSALKKMFLGGLETLAARRPGSVILFTNHDLIPLHQEGIRQRVSGRFQICFQGRRELEQIFVQHPHLLWKYFKWSPFLRSYHSEDAEGLREAILPDELAAVIPLERLPHPAIKSVDLGRGARIRVVGKPGAGKSVALWRLLARLEETEVLLLRSLDGSKTWAHLEQLLIKPGTRCMLVVDDLHDQLAVHGGAGTLGDLCELADRLGPDVGICVAYRSTHREQVEGALPPRFWMNHRFHEIALDDPPPDFIADVISLACETLAIDADPEVKQGFVQGVIEWENTPACAVSSLLPYRGHHLKEGFFPVSLAERATAWSEAFQSLVRSERRAEVDLLQAVAALRASGLREAPLAAVREVFEKVSERGFGEFGQALRRLQAAGWLRLTEGLVSGHDTQVMPDVVELVSEGNPGPWIEEFRQLLLADKFETLKADQGERLHALSRLYWDAGLVGICEELANHVLSTSPNDVRGLLNRGLSRIRLGRTPDGIADLRNAVSQSPDKVRPFEALFLALMRAERQREAKVALDEWLSRGDRSAEALRFASYCCLLLGDKEREAKVARMLWDSQRDAISASILLDVMVARGEKKKAERFFARIARRWPHSGHIHFAAANLHYSRGQKKEALHSAEQAVHFSPNEPSAQALYAWLLIEQGMLREAEAIVENARRLMPQYPDLLALDGMILTIRGKAEEAVARLRLALEFPERFNVARLGGNAYLALGDALSRLQKWEEADRAFASACRLGIPRWFCLARHARCSRAGGRVDDAIASLKKAIRQPTCDTEAWLDLAEAYSDLNKHEEAARTLRLARKRYPQDQEVLTRLVTELFHLRQFKAALPIGRRLAELAPGAWEHRRTLGLCLRYLGRHKEALREFDASIKCSPECSTTFYNKAESLEALERWDEALEAYEQSERLGKQEGATTLARKGVCLGKMGRLDEAIHVFEEALRAEDKSPELHYNYGYALAKAGRYEAALDQYSRALCIRQDFKDAWLGKARAHLHCGDHEQAAEALTHAVDPRPPYQLRVWFGGGARDGYFSLLAPAMEMADDLLQKSPRSLNVLLVCARVKYSTGWVPNVLELCDRALVEAPGHPEFLLLKARAANRMASMATDVSLRSKMLRLAIQTAEEGSGEVEATHGLLLQKVVALGWLGEAANAVAAFRQAKCLGIRSADDWAMSGYALGRLGADEDALFAFERALENDSGNLDALRGKAFALRDLRRWDDARAAFDKVIALAPKDSDLLCERATMFFQMGNLTLAAKEFARVLKRNPKDVDAHILYAGCVSDPIVSRQHLQRAIELRPNSVEAHAQLGSIDLNEGHLEVACEHLRTAVSLSPSDCRARRLLAGALFAQGKNDEAKKEYETCLSVFPDPLARHQYASLLHAMGDEATADHQRQLAVESVGGSIDDQKGMIQRLLHSGPAEGIILHLKRIVELAPTVPAHHRAYASALSAAQKDAEASHCYREALNLDEASWETHADYAAHLARTGQMVEAVSHFERAWGLRDVPVEEQLERAVWLVEVAFQMQAISFIGMALCEALDLAVARDEKTYLGLKNRTVAFQEWLRKQATASSVPSSTMSEALCLVGVLDCALRDTTQARRSFREACGVSTKDRSDTAALNWCRTLIDTVKSGDKTLSPDESREAIHALEETVTACGDSQKRQVMEGTLSELRSLLQGQSPQSE